MYIIGQPRSENVDSAQTHSYFCLPDDPRTVTMTARHGVVFFAGVRQRNFFGVQWHPEKSGETGDRLLRSFAALAALPSPSARGAGGEGLSLPSPFGRGAGGEGD